MRETAVARHLLIRDGLAVPAADGAQRRLRTG
jgi:hypothetical protein